jgi:V/A-type H+/Na+-transporting ATPase subunit D
MRRRDLPATKSNLLRLKEDFGFVKSGHDLLEQKLDVLVEELLDVTRQAVQQRRQVERDLAAVYANLRSALLADGREAVETEALAAEPLPDLRIRERSIMGVPVPLLDFVPGDEFPGVGAPGWNSPASTRVHGLVRRLLPALVHLAELEGACLRLAVELQKTKRKVNALENVFIPEYAETIHFIEGSLEEKEREALFQLKRLKSRREENPA